MYTHRRGRRREREEEGENLVNKKVGGLLLQAKKHQRLLAKPQSRGGTEANASQPHKMPNRIFCNEPISI